MDRDVHRCLSTFRRRDRPWCPGRDSNPYAALQRAAGFKPAASTDFATRASLVPMRESLWPGTRRAARLSDAICARVLPNDASVSPAIRLTAWPSRVAKSITQRPRKTGGAGRSRTDLLGFAIRCITALLPRRRVDHRDWARRRDSMKKGSRGFPGSLCGAGEESRTLDLNLGKVALYQLSYSRIVRLHLSARATRRQV